MPWLPPPGEVVTALPSGDERLALAFENLAADGFASKAGLTGPIKISKQG